MNCPPTSTHEKANLSNRTVCSRSEAEVDLIREIEKRSSPLVLTPGHILFREGDESKHLYLLKRGEVIFTILSFDQTVPCFSVGAGSLLGLSAVVTSTPFALSATASPDAEVSQISADDFLEWIEESATRYMCVLRLLAEETLTAHQALADLLLSS